MNDAQLKNLEIFLKKNSFAVYILNFFFCLNDKKKFFLNSIKNIFNSTKLK